MHTALRWAGRSPEDIAWLFLPGACSDLSGFTRASSSFGKRKGDAVSTSPEITAKSSWTLQRWSRVGAEIPVQRTSPASLHTIAESHSASPIPMVPQGESQITSAQPWGVLFLSEDCVQMASQPSFPPS